MTWLFLALVLAWLALTAVNAWRAHAIERRWRRAWLEHSAQQLSHARVREASTAQRYLTQAVPAQTAGGTPQVPQTS